LWAFSGHGTTLFTGMVNYNCYSLVFSTGLAKLLIILIIMNFREGDCTKSGCGHMCNRNYFFGMMMMIIIIFLKIIPMQCYRAISCITMK
jgi:hypothetical protein